MPKLILCATPLGNIEDISIRGLRTIFESDYVYAEDTRSFFKLKSILKERFATFITQLGINENTRQHVDSYREENHKKATPEIIKILKEHDVVLVSDAGIPAISDPGFRLIEEVYKAGFEVDVIPGGTAVDSALVLSGLPTDKFTFLGFLPREKGKIKKIIEASFNDYVSSLVIYESPYRVLKTLEIIKEINPDLKVAAVNDITKKFQKVVRGDINEVISRLKKLKIVGEWVIVIF